MAGGGRAGAGLPWGRAPCRDSAMAGEGEEGGAERREGLTARGATASGVEGERETCAG
jgi:hypothetical protein